MRSSLQKRSKKLFTVVIAVELLDAIAMQIAALPVASVIAETYVCFQQMDAHN